MGDVTLLSVCLVLSILTWRIVMATDHQQGGDNNYEHRFHANSTNATVCCNLDTVLQQAHNVSSNTSVYISLTAGEFTLSSNHLAAFYNWNKLAIVGESKSKTIVKCSDGVGLSFLESDVIVLRNLNITECGANHISTSRDPNNTSQVFVKYLEIQSAIYFLACSDITMEDVYMSDSAGTGLVIYNTGGVNQFIRCSFKNNYVDVGKYGGGGVVMEFSYCVPGDTTCNDATSNVQVKGSTYLFKRCYFTNNIASNGKLARESIYTHGTNHMAFGKGGAIAFHFKGRSKDNSVFLEDCTIYGNAASWAGGGIYLGFGDQSINNSVHMYITVVSEWSYNLFSYNRANSSSSSGGGAKIEFIHHSSDPAQLWSGYTSNVVNNSVILNGTKFGNNVAHVGRGGGVSVSTSREGLGQESTNSLVFDGCQFECNMAVVGFAVDLSLQHPDVTSSNGVIMTPLFRNCEFSENLQDIQNLTHYRETIGTIYVNRVPAKFEGITNFTNNPGSAMVVSNSYISLMNSSRMIFTGNKGRLGGALAFISNAWLVAYEATELLFLNNSVGVNGTGGAIYAVQYGTVDKQNCFFMYYKYLQDPSQWNTKITFSGNTAKSKKNSIYVSSVLPCARSIADSSETFCNHPWIFQDTDSNCTTQVDTGPSKMNVSQMSMKVVPGWDNKVGIHVFNNYGVEIPAVYKASPVNEEDMKVVGVSSSTEYISNDFVKVFGKPNQTAKLHFETLDPQVILSMMIVEISSCPPGFRAVSCNTGDTEMICDCKCANPGDGMTCNDESHEAKLLSYHCLTHKFDANDSISSSYPLILGKCPYNQKQIHLNAKTDLQRDVCGSSNRYGTLCSKCQEDYGVDINSYNFKCIRCHPATGWLVYLALEIVPITLFFMLIAILNISATSAPMNAFVFFSQIVSIPYFQNPYPFFYSPYFLNSKWLQTSVLLPYGIWNLDFFRTDLFPGVCLGKHITTIEALALNYVKAFYPMLLILVCYILIRLYDCNVKVVHWLWKPFRWCLKQLHKRHEPKTSIIDAFATFLLLSYTKFMFVSFPLLAPVTLYNGEAESVTSLDQVVFYFDASVEFHGKYLVLGVVAAIVVLIFVVLPPLLLIVYPFRIFQRCFGRMPFRIAIKTFVDAFQGDFRDGIEQGMDCRCFAGLYFLFRIAIFIIFITPLGLAQQYLVQQIFFTCCIILFTMVKPYREELYNKLDILFFFLLALMNALSFYSSQIFERNHQDSSQINDGSHEDKSIAAFVINYILGLVPMFYIAGMVGYVILIWMGCLKKRVISKPSEDIVVIGDDGSQSDPNEPFTYVYNPHNKSEEDIPDRLLNPQNYASRNMYKSPMYNATYGTNTTSHSQPASKEAISEGSYFFEKETRKELHPYGSTSVTEPPMKHRGQQRTQLKSFPDEF